MEKVAKSMKLDVTASIDFTRNDSVEGLGHARTGARTRSPSPWAPSSARTNISGRKVIYKVVDQQHVDPAKLVQERAKVLRDLKQQKAQIGHDAVHGQRGDQLMAEGKVKNPRRRDQAASRPPSTSRTDDVIPCSTSGGV